MGALASIDARGHIPERRVRPNGVVFLLPQSNNSLRMVEGIKLVHAKTFVTDFPVEGFHEAIFPGLPGRERLFLFH